MSHFISLVVPTYNERDNIVPLIERIYGTIRHYDCEILFIDDSSSDGTKDIIQNLIPAYPLRLIIRKDKKGLASAVLDGFNETRGDIIGSMNADLQHPPEILSDLIERIEEGAELAIASRYVEGGNIGDWRFSRRVISRGATYLAHLLLPSTRQIADPMSGFYIFRRSVIENATLQPNGYKTLIEVLTKGNFHRVAEVPYTFRARLSGRSKLGIGQNLDYLRQLLRLMLQTGELKRFLKFCLVGLSGTLVNMALLFALTELAKLPYLISSAIAIESAIVTNFLLNDFYTFSDRRAPTTKSFFGRLLKFNLISLIGLGINMGVLWLLTEIAGVYYILSNLLGIVSATLFRYVFNLWWTWR